MKSGAKKLLQSFNLEVNVTAKPAQEIMDHLKDYTLGTPGRLLYHQTRIEDKIRNLGTCYFLVLKRLEKIIGTIGFCLRTTRYKSTRFNSWYVRYFSIKAPLRTKVHKKKARIRDLKTGDSIIKTAVEKVFANPDSFFTGRMDESTKSFIYAYIERDNIRSADFSTLVGFERVRSLTTVVFSRFRPKFRQNVTRIKENEKTIVSKRLKEFYQDHTMFCEQNLFIDNNYYVYKIEDEIVAGVQANPEAWEIKKIPGIYGFLVMKVASKIPGLNRILQHDLLRFTAVEAIYYKEGYEKYLTDLFESVCALQHNYFVFTWLDACSPVYGTVKKLGSLGTLSKLTRSIKADINVKFINWSEEEKKIYTDNPAYISVFDLT